VLELECLPLVKPTIEDLLGLLDQNKQRAAAELIAGIIGGRFSSGYFTLDLLSESSGSKHWCLASQEQLWDWLTPLFPKMLGNNVRTDSLHVWTTFLEVGDEETIFF
jgi:proteasome activator subunit 4